MTVTEIIKGKTQASGNFLHLSPRGERGDVDPQGDLGFAPGEFKSPNGSHN